MREAIWIASCTFVFIGTFTRLSLLLFFLRADLTRATWYRTTIIVAMCLMICYTIASFFASVFTCQPIAKVFDARIQDGKCGDLTATNIGTAIWNLTTHLLVFLLSLRLITWPGLSVIHKTGMAAIFAVGVMCVT